MIGIFNINYDPSGHKEGKTISNDIVQLVYKKRNERLKQELWRRYLESEEYNEIESVPLNQGLQIDLNMETGENYNYNMRIYILNVLVVYKEERMLEKYCEKIIKEREGKILEELNRENRDQNMLIVAISIDNVENPKYVLELIQKNPGRIKHMAYILQSTYNQLYEICERLENKDIGDVQQLLREAKVEEIEGNQGKEEMDKDIIRLKQKKTIFERILKLKNFYQIYQRVYTTVVQGSTLYVSSIDDEMLYVQERLEEKFEEMTKEEDKCVICLEKMNKFLGELKTCEACQNYYHTRCVERVNKCPICREKM